MVQDGLEPAVRLNTLQLHTSPTWLRLRSSAPVSGQVLVDTTWTAASCVLMSSPLLGASFLPNAGIYNSSGTPSQKSLSAKIESRTSASIASLGPERGFLPFLLPPNPTSRHLHFGSAYVAVSAFLFGPKTPTALFAARSWTNEVTTPLFAGAVVIV